MFFIGIIIARTTATTIVTVSAIVGPNIAHSRHHNSSRDSTTRVILPFYPGSPFTTMGCHGLSQPG